MSETVGLYPAIVAYEDAASSFGVQTMTTQSAYGKLAAAIGGHGDLEEAQARFALEFPILAVMFEDCRTAAFALLASVAEARDWQQSFTVARSLEEPPSGIGEYRQAYGQRGDIATEDLLLQDCE